VFLHNIQYIYHLSETLDALYVEDEDEEGFSLFFDAIKENDVSLNIQRVNDGQELVDFLGKGTSKSPKLIISDLNMPKKYGLEAVRGIRKNRYPLKLQ
jgi:CheY-like chemotaxis protein